MNEATKRQPGRPPSGVTKERPSLSLDKRLMKQARRTAKKEGIPLSAWVEMAVAKHLPGDPTP